jgi:MFS family permease
LLIALERALEAGYFPGAVYLLSTWYVRYDMQKRYTLFYGIGCVATAFCGILAYGLGQMNGLAGLGGWRWIFIIEGILSCLCALAGYVFLVGFPEDAHKSWHFLNESERDFIIRRVNRDRGDAITEPFTLGAFLKSAGDFKVWVFAFMFFCVTTVGYSINYFLPIIFLGMGMHLPLSLRNIRVDRLQASTLPKRNVSSPLLGSSPVSLCMGRLGSATGIACVRLLSQSTPYWL